MKHQIDPTVDCVFKAILGHAEHTHLLIHFLNAVLRRTGTRRIVEVTIANPYNEREFVGSKLSIVDVKAVDQAGRQYQIEVQRAIHAGLEARMLFTWSAIYHGLLREGGSFLALRPVIAIWLLREALFPDIEAYHLPFGVYNLRHRRRLTEHLEIHALQLPKWRFPDHRPNALDRWMYFFKEGKHLDPAHPPEFLHTREMTEAMNTLMVFSEKEQNYLLYEQRLEAERVERTWREQLDQAMRDLERARRDQEREHQARERERQEKERLLREQERERQEKERLLRKQERERRETERLQERARQEQEKLLQEMERLQALLRKSGIDPAQAE